MPNGDQESLKGVNGAYLSEISLALGQNSFLTSPFARFVSPSHSREIYQLESCEKISPKSQGSAHNVCRIFELEIPNLIQKLSYSKRQFIVRQKGSQTAVRLSLEVSTLISSLRCCDTERPFHCRVFPASFDINSS